MYLQVVYFHYISQKKNKLFWDKQSLNGCLKPFVLKEKRVCIEQILERVLENTFPF